MFTTTPGIQEIVLSAVLLVAGFALGYLIDRLVLGGLIRRRQAATERSVLVLLRSLRGMPEIWLTVAASELVISILPFTEPTTVLVRQITVVILILSATVVLVRAATVLVARYARRTETLLPSISIFVTITQVLLFILGGLVVLQFLGISITPMLTALGVAGLAVALALQDTLSNLFAGFHLIASRKVRPGDYIKLDTGEEGYVTDVTWRNTTMREIPNNIVIIPNQKLAEARVINYYLPQLETGLVFEVGVSYDSDLRHVERVTLEVANELRGLFPTRLSDFEPYIRYHTFSDFSVNFRVMIHVKEYMDHIFIRHEFMKMLHERYREEGIVIPFPISTVEFRSRLEVDGAEPRVEQDEGRV